jgi:predicted TIM-barrel fold metal-dependent hydrolase
MDVIETGLLERAETTQLPMNKRPISADSHVIEPPSAYRDFIEAKYRDSAPRIVTDANKGDVYIIEGFPAPVAIGQVAAAGIDPKEMKWADTRFEDLHKGGWDPVQRMLDQDRDGVAGEMIYPSIGMALCALEDPDYKNATMWAYNRWLQEYVAGAPNRLWGVGQTAIRSVAEAVEDFRRIKEMGFKSVMLPCNPATDEDYDHPSFDPLWRAAVELDLPISFHILTARGKKQPGKASEMPTGERGPAITMWNGVIRAVQDVIGMFIFGGVFERHPKLKLVCVEGDAGWVPHFTYRMDHIYNRHRFWMKCPEMSRLPSEQFAEQVWLTFQDDWTAFRMVHLMNHKRLMWANDFPHGDATWPWSQELLAKHTADMDPAVRQDILRNNVVELYNLGV